MGSTSHCRYQSGASLTEIDFLQFAKDTVYHMFSDYAIRTKKNKDLNLEKAKSEKVTIEELAALKQVIASDKVAPVKEMGNAKKYFIFSDKKDFHYGPYNRKSIDQFLKLGHITLDDMAWEAGQNDMVPLRNLL